MKRLAPRAVVLGATATAGMVALIVSLPKDASPRREAIAVGEMVEDRTGGYDLVHALQRASVLSSLFPEGFDPRVPHQSYGGAPPVWYYYAHHSHNPNRRTNYLMQSVSDTGPSGSIKVGEKDGVAVYVLDQQVWMGQQALRPPTPAGSDLYAMPRNVFFRYGALRNNAPIIAVNDVVKRVFGIDVAGKLREAK